MCISIVFKKIGFNICIGKKSADHRQACYFSIDKMYFVDGKIDFAKQLICI
jgi:hypothetical protein